MKEKLKTAWRCISNPRFLLCFFVGWMITNGWSYIAFALGTIFHQGWLIAIAGAYLAFLWLPISPEKPVTFAIAIALMRKLFPDDQRTLAVLRGLYDRTKALLRRKRDEHAVKKAAKKARKAAPPPDGTAP